MKKTTIIIVLAVLCLNFRAQAQENKAIDLTKLGLQVGQQAPDFAITNLHNYKDASGKLATTAKLSDFKGKLLILDFWATWCSPCVAMIPKMDNLQKQFKDKIQFISVTYEAEKVVLPFLAKWEEHNGLHPILPVATSDIALKQMFPHRYLPHYVWIDGDGKVKSITSHEEITAENIGKLLGGATPLKQKVDLKVTYDKTKPLFINGNGGDGSNLRYHSILTNYQPGLHSSYTYENIRGKDSPPRITARNLTYELLFTLAYGGDSQFFGANRVLNNVKNTEARAFPGIGDVETWKAVNVFCYELILPIGTKLNPFELMRKDLAVLFDQYTAKIEKRKVKCVALQRTSAIDKVASKGGTNAIDLNPFGFTIKNASLNTLVSQLGIKFQQKSPYPLVNLTDYIGRVDITINAKLTDMNAINEALKAYDLAFVVTETETEVLVIDDKI